MYFYLPNLDCFFTGGNGQRVQKVLQGGEVIIWVAAQVGRMYRLLPLSAVHVHSSLSPDVNQLFHHCSVAHCIVFTEEEESGSGNWAVVEHLDAGLVEVCRVGFEKPEVKHGSVFDEALKTWHQSSTNA